MRNLHLIAISATLVLAACGVDTTGIQENSTRPPHPQSTVNAAVTVTEFADLQCPACARAHALLVKPLLQSHGTKIRYEFRHFPLQSIHRFALGAAEAAECAADQGKFWEYLDAAYAEQELLSTEQMKAWAADLDLDQDLFDRCLRSRIKKEVVLADYDAGREMNVQGTPTFFVNGVLVPSDPDALGKAIDTQLATVLQKL